LTDKENLSLSFGIAIGKHKDVKNWHRTFLTKIESISLLESNNKLTFLFLFRRDTDPAKGNTIGTQTRAGFGAI
jgi:hypothetical protein